MFESVTGRAEFVQSWRQCASMLLYPISTLVPRSMNLLGQYGSITFNSMSLVVLTHHMNSDSFTCIQRSSLIGFVCVYKLKITCRSFGSGWSLSMQANCHEKCIFKNCSKVRTLQILISNVSRQWAQGLAETYSHWLVETS